MIEKHPSYNCSSEVPPPAWRRSRQREILVCPPHLHTHTHTLLFPSNPILCHSSSILLCSVSLVAYSSPTHPLPPLALLSSVTPDQKDLDPTWNVETLEGYILHFPGERLQRHRANGQEKQNLSISPPSVSLSLSLSSPLLLIPLSLGAFISSLSVFCLVTYFEMLNLPPRFELIIKSERVHGPAP